MNIFVLDADPELCSMYHVDRHVVKMPIECTQMLSTTLRERCNIDYGYKSTYINHPCTKWVGRSFENFLWTYNLGMELCKEYTHRYEKVHATSHVLRGMVEYFEPIKEATRANVGMTPFYAAVNIRYKDLNPILAYRCQYADVKKRLHVWTNRSVPEFLGNPNSDSYKAVYQILAKRRVVQ